MSYDVMSYKEIKKRQDAVLERYGDVPVVFTSYYKFTFTFCGDVVALDGKPATLSVSIGGSSDEIYKTSVTADQIKLRDVAGQEDLGYTAVYRDGKEIEELLPSDWW